MHIVTQALRAAQRFLSGDHWKALELSPLGKQSSDKAEDLHEFVRASGGRYLSSLTISHIPHY
jgi:hypothetical protein